MSEGNSNISHQFITNFGDIGVEHHKMLVGLAGHWVVVGRMDNTTEFESSGKNSGPYINPRLNENLATIKADQNETL